MALANRTTGETRRSEIDRGRSGDSGPGRIERFPPSAFCWGRSRL